MMVKALQEEGLDYEALATWIKTKSPDDCVAFSELVFKSLGKNGLKVNLVYLLRIVALSGDNISLFIIQDISSPKRCSTQQRSVIRSVL